MKRVMVIGSGGAGKSTFSKKLGELTGLSVIHLDSLYWKPGWRETPRPEWEKVVERLAEEDEWIMDGNYSATRAVRIKAADTVIFLDIPRIICLYRVIKRAVKYRGQSRPDMAEGCDEKLNREFLGWVWNYPKRSRVKMLNEMRSYPEKRFIIIRSTREAEDLLRSLRAGQ